ncbi:serine threonine phosphatase 2A 65 kDa regulatory subunit A beta isoform, putative [Babesia ovis]|uniref:Serine threonine phosphatase 2A 65 kDa regulatory subunit A beta isoform, putative n=1 Tax=Babesia ovis TaxID=5869 RepID=A0A9W5TBH4_BABOV|nr:serine threonine phosphatase 2A 65 kDa regulatory subunit A beta isoform, putative [Babesia ovis]
MESESPGGSTPKGSPYRVICTPTDSEADSEQEWITETVLDPVDGPGPDDAGGYTSDSASTARSDADWEPVSDPATDSSPEQSAGSESDTQVDTSDANEPSVDTSSEPMVEPGTDTKHSSKSCKSIHENFIANKHCHTRQPETGKNDSTRKKPTIEVTRKGQRKHRKKKDLNKLVTEVLADLAEDNTIRTHSSSYVTDGTEHDEFIENTISYPAFEYFKCEILGSDGGAIEALKQVDIVTQQLNPELCETMLVPFLTEAQRSMPVHLLRLIVDVWYTLSKISNTESYICAIIQGVAYLISQEDPSIRRKAVELIVEIVNDVSSSDTCYDVMGSAVMPLLKQLSESEWFADAVSACNLIPLLYAEASKQDKCELRECYKHLWESNLTIVRLEVARNLEKLLPIMNMDDSISMFWLVLKNMSVYHQDQVRAHCVDACLSFARRCTPEQNLSFSYPVILAAAGDPSWRVRKALAERYDRIHEIFGEDELVMHLLDTHFDLLNDSEDIVKDAAVGAFVDWCHALSIPLAERYITFFESHLEESSNQVRQYICNIFATFASKMDPERVGTVLGPLVRRLLRDECTDVRLCILNKIELLCEPEDFDKGIGAQINETIDRVLQTTHWRHRLILAEKITTFNQHFGFHNFEKHFLPILFRLLMDNVWKVRATVLGCIEDICAECKQSWVSDTILTELIKIYVEPRNSRYVATDDVPLSYAFKITIIQALVAVAKSLDVQNALARMIPVLLKATKDPTANVRFVAIKAMRSLFLIYKDDSPEPLLRLRGMLMKLREDADLDVRYYAKMAIDTCDACFPTD